MLLILMLLLLLLLFLLSWGSVIVIVVGWVYHFVVDVDFIVDAAYSNVVTIIVIVFAVMGFDAVYVVYIH